MRSPVGEFVNEPFVNFAKPENARAMRAALDHVAGQLGREYDLIIGGHRERTKGKITSTPSQQKILSVDARLFWNANWGVQGEIDAHNYQVNGASVTYAGFSLDGIYRQRFGFQNELFSEAGIYQQELSI